MICKIVYSHNIATANFEECIYEKPKIWNFGFLNITELANLKGGAK